MCENLMKSELTEVTVYKMVSKNEKTGRYHSVLTGNVYPVNKDIPVWVSQRNKKFKIFSTIVLPGTKSKNKWLCSSYPRIKSLPSYSKPEQMRYGWTPDIIGRTFGFTDFRDANAMIMSAKDREERGEDNTDSTKGYTLVVVKAKMTKEIMSGTYGGDPVMGGRRMEILEEVA